MPLPRIQTSRVFSSRPRLRWAVPAAVVAVVAGGVAATSSADAAAPLPERTATQLLADVAGARSVPVSGTVTVDADLGLPTLPTGSGGDGTGLSSLVSGSHVLRVWSDGAQKSRVAVTGDLGETDVVRSGADLWVWSASEHTAVHRTLDPAQLGAAAGSAATGPGSGALAAPSGAPHASSLTPAQAAQQALAAVDPTTQVTTGGSLSVAGRDAYSLVVTPRDASTLVGSVRIAVDAVTHVPLSVKVFARGAADPAVDVTFTKVDFSAPPASTFTFTPPEGAKVTEGDTSAASGNSEPSDSFSPAPDAAAQQPTVVGSGWTAVVVARTPAPTGAAGATSSPGDLSGVLTSLPEVSGAWGSGHLLTSALVSVLVTDDGRVLVGAVPPQRLTEVAASVPAAG